MDIIRSLSMHRARVFASTGGHGADKLLFGASYRSGFWLI